MIFISSSVIKDRSIENIIGALSSIGVSNIELSGGTSYDAGILRKLKKHKIKLSLRFLVHNYFPIPKKDFVLNIASIEEKNRRRSIDFVKGSINLAHRLGADRYTLHAGYAKELKPLRNRDYFISSGNYGINLDKAIDGMFDSLDEIACYAKNRKIKIGVENLFPIRSMPGISLLTTPGQIFEFLDFFSEEKTVGLLLDLGHLLISANHFQFDKDGFLKKLKEGYSGKIFGIHLSGNNGKIDSHGLLSEESWQLKAAKRFDLSKVPLTIESRGIGISCVRDQLRMVDSFLNGGIKHAA